MEVAAVSLSEARFRSPEEYRSYLRQILEKSTVKLDLAVLPAHSALFFAWSCGLQGNPCSFREATRAYLEKHEELNKIFIDLHGELARQYQLYLASGTILEGEDGRIFHSSILFDRKGQVIGCQRQTHLSRLEKDMGFSRGEELQIFNTELGKLGFVVHNDSWYPEVSRILALQGAEIICHPGALPEEHNSCRQLAGMWQETQQNQFFCVESQLVAPMAGEFFAAISAIHAPCEMTENKTGFLIRGEAGQSTVSARLDFAAREQVLENYPLLSFLNPDAYRRYFPGIYHNKLKQEVR
ncbi:MAG: hypothetical protein C4554_07480 [Dethiobacter sp.]|jgi:predicted amidohydrolase|nr:MAG: hypothetical protein C4554_07480 [Dethiobacter sp.]